MKHSIAEAYTRAGVGARRIRRLAQDLRDRAAPVPVRVLASVVDAFQQTFDQDIAPLAAMLQENGAKVEAYHMLADARAAPPAVSALLPAARAEAAAVQDWLFDNIDLATAQIEDRDLGRVVEVAVEIATLAPLAPLLDALIETLGEIVD